MEQNSKMPNQPSMQEMLRLAASPAGKRALRGRHRGQEPQRYPDAWCFAGRTHRAAEGCGGFLL